MTTPAGAGALVMLFSNTLAQQFPLIFDRASTALGFSLLFGFLAVIAVRKPWQRTIYYVVNSKTIFCVAIGANITVVESASAKHADLFNPIGLAVAKDTTDTEPYIEIRASDRPSVAKILLDQWSLEDGKTPPNLQYLESGQKILNILFDSGNIYRSLYDGVIA